MDAPPTLLRMEAVGHFEGVTSGYRPQLDGVRTIAVYLVVAFHAGLAGFAGGFIGVDIFFVLSVYLITGLLLRELEAGGRIRLSRFYARRYRRLLPAALVVWSSPRSSTWRSRRARKRSRWPETFALRA